jgi:molybdopterin converting factor small subunit
MSDTASNLEITVRYFAAAREAAGLDTETLHVESETTVAGLIDSLSRRDSRIASVLSRCSFLYDGVAVRDFTIPLQPGYTIDVLPPFAGG